MTSDSDVMVDGDINRCSRPRANPEKLQGHGASGLGPGGWEHTPGAGRAGTSRAGSGPVAGRWAERRWPGPRSREALPGGTQSAPATSRGSCCGHGLPVPHVYT